MQIPFTPAVVLLLAVVAQAVFAAGLLWAAPANRLPNRFLALLMLAIALWLLDGFFRVANIYGQDPDWYFAPIYYSFAFGPLLYFYVQSIVNRDFRLRRGQLWHFAPVLAQAALYWWLRTQDYNTRNWFWQTVHQPYTYRVEFIGTWVSLMVYFGLSLRRLRRYRRYLDDNFSETSALRLRWLRTLLLLLAVVSVQWLVEVVLREFFGIYYRYDYSTELLGGVLLLIGVVGLRQADMGAVRFAEDETEAGTDYAPPQFRLAAAPPAAQPLAVAPLVVGLGAGEAAPVAVSPAFRPSVALEPATGAAGPMPTISAAGFPTAAESGESTLVPDAAAEAADREAPAVDPAVQERIRRALEDERLYLNPTLTLAELAAHTGLPARLISFTVNKGFGKSFNDLVNGYRVAEVQRRLARTDDALRLTLLGIAFESGFNSKTTFNRIFKQFTGLAPSEFGRGR